MHFCPNCVMAFVAAVQSLPSWGIANLLWPVYRRLRPDGFLHPWRKRVPGLGEWDRNSTMLNRVLNLAMWWFAIWSVVKVIIWLTV